MSDVLSTAEVRLLEFILAGDDPVLKKVSSHAPNWQVTRREWTGSGFYFALGVEGEPPAVTGEEEWLIDDAGCTMGNTECHLILRVMKSCQAAELEGYAPDGGRVESNSQPSSPHYLWTQDPAVRELAYLQGKWAVRQKRRP